MIKEILDFWIDAMPEAYSIQMDSKTFGDFMIEFREWAKKYGAAFAEKKPDLQKYRQIDIEVVETYARYLRVH